MTKEKSPFVTIESLAQYLQVSVSTIRVWVRNGHIPDTTYIKLGNTYRFNRDKAIEGLIAAQKAEQPESASMTVTATGTVGTIEVDVSNNKQLEFDFDADDDV